MVKRVTNPVNYLQPYRYPSPDVPLAVIRRFVRQIAECFHPEKIILFGSYAYGTPHEDSDVDLMVIMPTRNAVSMALRMDLAFDPPFSLDLQVRTPKQIKRGLKANDWFLREIAEKGKVLYEARDDEMDSKGRRRHARRSRSRCRTGTLSQSSALSHL